MEENLKQRLVGAAVLVALAVIFLPAVFDKDERVAIDTTSQIPSAPLIEPPVIPLPTKPEGIQVPPAEELFQPTVVEEDSKLDLAIEADQVGSRNENIGATPDIKPEPKPIPKVTPKATPKPESVKVEAKPKPVVSKPTLNASGVPVGWVIQAASFKSAETAKNFTDKLLKANYKAYFKSVDTSKGEYFRVFTGPYIDEQKAIEDKRAIDKLYKVSSRVLRFNPASGN